MRSLKQFEQVRQWASERGLYAFGDLKSQTIKLGEEYGELCRGIMKRDQKEIKDALGDMTVVLINAAHLAGYRLEDCLEVAWQEIKDRQGKMHGGTFIKDEQPLSEFDKRMAEDKERLDDISIRGDNNCYKCGKPLDGNICANKECALNK